MYYADWVPFEDWCRNRTWMRNAFWRTQDFANLERARYSHWVMKQRHWPESHLVECLADLRSSPRRRRTRRRTK
jgi:hypothetical protein